MADDSKSNTVLVYGSYGYSALMICQRLVDLGIKPILSGRNEQKLQKQSQDLGGLEYVACTTEELKNELSSRPNVSVVLNCAGPFTRTFDNVVDACISNKVHYLDITGEINIFEKAAQLDQKASEAGVVVMPGVGFDVVPTDCLARHLKERLPSADNLEMAFYTVGGGGLSHGTATTAVEGTGKPGLVRRDGKLVVSKEFLSKKISFRSVDQPLTVTCCAIPWGDVSTAYHTTGIPNITVYLAAPGFMGTAMWMGSFRPMAWLMGTRPIKAFNKWAFVPKGGPTPEQCEKGTTFLWGQAWNTATGDKVQSLLQTRQGYMLTCLAGVECALRLLNGTVKEQGFMTPAKLFGSNFIVEIPDSKAKFDDIE